MSDILPNRDIDLREKGGLIFYEQEHAYYNADGVKYTGMTTFLKQFEGESFDADRVSKYKAIKEILPEKQMKQLKALIISKLNEPSRTAWTKVHLFFDKLCTSSEKYGEALPKKQQEFLDAWEKSSVDGSIEHDRREREVMEHGVEWNGKHYPFVDKNILEVTKDDVCVIPEIMVWDHEAQLCGLIDLPIFDKGVIHILDYKTNKKIEKNGFMGRKMLGPFRFHPDCNLSKYSGQLYGYQKMACDLTGFSAGENWIISTASVEHKRKTDTFIECLDMSKEINEAFASFKKQIV